MSTYYIVGKADTRGEFYPQGVTKSLAKAEKFKKQLESEMYQYARQWIAIKPVDSIR